MVEEEDAFELAALDYNYLTFNYKMSLHYSFIARDPDMVVFETLLTKELSSRPFKRESRQKLLELEEETKESRP